MKISVIVPVFNAQNYLKRCLDSVLNQTLADIEVICIDDCSSDNSYEILQQYANTDVRLKYYKNEQNIGQGLTRNRGIDIAQGEYIAFVDSDDWIEADMYEVLYSKTAIQNYDLICGNLISDFPDGFSGVPKMPTKNLITLDFLINEALAPSIEFFSPNSPCDKIYKKKAIDSLNLRFESERKFLYEDKLFNLMFLSSNPSFFFEPTVFYHYMIRYGSTMTSYKENFIERYFQMDKRINEVLSQSGFLCNEQKIRLQRSIFEMTFVFCLNALVYNKSTKGKISNFWELINDKRISSNIKMFKIADIPKSTSKINGIVKVFCFLIIKYLR